MVISNTTLLYWIQKGEGHGHSYFVPSFFNGGVKGEGGGGVDASPESIRMEDIGSGGDG